MIIKQLVLKNFRNYEIGNWHFNQGINVFYGENGQGKTNILEAMHFSALGCSHRTHQEEDLIKNNADNMSVNITFSRKEIEQNLTIKKKSSKSSKEIFFDQHKIKPRELIGELKVTMFSPEDLQLVKSDPSLRRRFIDMEIAQVSSLYCFSLARYNKIVQQRNRLLKEIKEKKAKETLLEGWDEQFAIEATFILEERLKAIKKISSLAFSFYNNISSAREKIDILYKLRSNEEDILLKEKQFDILSWYKNSLEKRRNKDIERSFTGIGPHRDDLFFVMNDQSIKSYGSQGQQRSFVLALKMAEMQFIKEECGEFPILLLDDVMSELDVKRRKNLLDFLHGRIQTFITLTEKEMMSCFIGASYYHICQGKVVEDSYEGNE